MQILFAAHFNMLGTHEKLLCKPSLKTVCIQEVFEREHQHNNMMTWALRVGGWALMFLGVSLTVRIVHTLGNTLIHTVDSTLLSSLVGSTENKNI